MMLHQSDVGAKGFQKGWKYRVDALKESIETQQCDSKCSLTNFTSQKIKSHKKKLIQPYQQRVYFYFLHRKNSVKNVTVASFGAPGKAKMCVVSPQLRHLHGAKSCAQKASEKNG